MSEPIETEKKCANCDKIFTGLGSFCTKTCEAQYMIKLQSELGLDPDGGQWGSCPGCGQSVFFYRNGDWNCYNPFCPNYGEWGPA